MRVAIFNGFNFHYEMFGFALDYCFSQGIVPVLYTNTDSDYGWLEEYAARFAKALDVRPVDSYTPNDVDVVFVLTDDDVWYGHRWGPIKPTARVLLFEHYARRSVMVHADARIPLRHYIHRFYPSGANKDTWILPVWNPYAAVAPPAPAPAPADGVVRVVAIGNNCPTTPEELAKWFHSLRGPIEFTFINRSEAPTVLEPVRWTDYPNIKICLDISTSDMLAAVERADWLLMLPRNIIQKHDAISAIVPLAFSFRKPLLVAADWVEAYGLRGGLVALDPTRPLAPPDAACMAALDAQREELFARRDALLTQHLAGLP